MTRCLLPHYTPQSYLTRCKRQRHRRTHQAARSRPRIHIQDHTHPSSKCPLIPRNQRNRALCLQIRASKSMGKAVMLHRRTRTRPCMPYTYHSTRCRRPRLWKNYTFQRRMCTLLAAHPRLRRRILRHTQSSGSCLRPPHTRPTCWMCWHDRASTCTLQVAPHPRRTRSQQHTQCRTRCRPLHCTPQSWWTRCKRPRRKNTTSAARPLPRTHFQDHTPPRRSRR